MIEAKTAQRRVFKPKLETKIRREEFQKVAALAAMEGKTKSEVVRDAVLFYLAAKEDEAYRSRESVLAQEMEAMTNRICAMLARQGRQIRVPTFFWGKPTLRYLAAFLLAWR